MEVYNLNVIQTFFVAIVVLLLGRYVQNRVPFCKKYFIPSPVIGGTIISIFLSIFIYYEIIQFNFDETIKTNLMIAFFATIGFSASFKFLFKGGKYILLFLFCAILLIFLQNLLAIFLSILMGFQEIFGIALGSIPLTGGHGTSASFAPILEDKFNLANASEISISAATFGLIAGCLLGGPIGKKLMKKHNLKPNIKSLKDSHIEPDFNENKVLTITERGLFRAIISISFAMAIGSVIFYFLNKYDIILPSYIGAMVAACIIRNISDIFPSKIIIDDHEISVIGSISLYLFLAMALMNMNLIKIFSLAFPMMVILIFQIILVGLFAYFVTFRIMGKDYDAAVISVGHCGFGLGATPNAMANMEAFTNKNYPSPIAFFTIPIVGSLFIDFFNSAIITLFLNLFG